MIGTRLLKAAGIGLIGLLVGVACGGGSSPQASAPPSSATAVLVDVPAIGALPTTPTPAPASGLAKPLKITPNTGKARDSFAIAAEDLPPGKRVDFVWETADGGYVLTASTENVQFEDKKFDGKRMPLGQATVDAQGRVQASFQAPDDYGEVHDIYAIVDGQDVARGGFRIMRGATLTPEQGPVGTPMTIRITGLGWKVYESTVSVRYDNMNTGIVTAVTTRGTAEFQIRAAGKAGKHVIDLNHGAKSLPFLNNQQSGTAHIPDMRLWFTITDDKATPAFAMDWPRQESLAQASDATPKTTAAAGSPASLSSRPAQLAALEPSSGPILSKTTLKVGGLQPNTDVEMFWVTVKGNRVSVSGWSLEESSLGTARSGSDGTLAASFEVPEGLGGWHTVKLVQGGKVVGEVPYFVERSLVDVTPRRVKAGETFTVHLKGVGWTELDNGVAMTYDNAYIGFACGFNSNGDVTMNLVATGGPGIHLIDLYPMLYQGHGKPPWGYQFAFLTFKDDFPGLSLGYKLPAFRLAIEVVE